MDLLFCICPTLCEWNDGVLFRVFAFVPRIFLFLFLELYGQLNLVLFDREFSFSSYLGIGGRDSDFAQRLGVKKMHKAQL